MPIFRMPISRKLLTSIYLWNTRWRFKLFLSMSKTVKGREKHHQEAYCLTTATLRVFCVATVCNCQVSATVSSCALLQAFCTEGRQILPTASPCTEYLLWCLSHISNSFLNLVMGFDCLAKDLGLVPPQHTLHRISLFPQIRPIERQPTEWYKSDDEFAI